MVRMAVQVLFGIEQAFELRGVDGLALQQNLSGRWLVISTDDPKDGYNVETTLDVKIQDQTMYSLRNMIERTCRIWNGYCDGSRNW